MWSDDTFYSMVTVEDCEEIIESHIKWKDSR